ncbi:integral peroxisomal membrane [Fusarium circinatum]|uniref:Integral peroxisomal membrane n=1 Tax=Fusarium circinatum TaxID=48490 RepID=A0A8H5T8U7_FUSCI|nr:integral peroxisomal membrane [Fusarium circinatum]
MSSRDDASHGASPPSYEPQPSSSGAPPTFASFSPVTLSANTPSRSSRRSTILVHQKSPLLLATPPQITRALAYSHPFLLPLNTFTGLLTWSTGDPWQSFLLLCFFWAVVLYGDVVITWAGPVLVGVALIVGMYGRRYSPLSSSGWNDIRGQNAGAKGANQNAGESSQQNGKANAGEKQSKHVRGNSEVTNTKHQKTLDEIVETLKQLTGRCNVLMEPLLDMTDFLSTQTTPTSATTRPALTVIFMRLLIITPVWIALTVPPFRVVTTRRVILVAGTIILTWHARVLRVSRAILWRSSTVRRLASAITGLQFDTPEQPFKKELAKAAKKGSDRVAQQQESELTKALGKSSSFQTNHGRRNGSAKTAGVKFTFIIYENQRRWIGLGWTNNLFAYERAAWTDDHNNSVPAKDDFELPEVEDGSRMQWRWVPGTRWRVDGVSDENGPVDYDGDEGKNGWIFYDNKWQNGHRGQDGWSRWTRRRKWYRDAELVEVDQPEDGQETEKEIKESPSVTKLRSQPYNSSNKTMVPTRAVPDQNHGEEISNDDASSKAADDSLSVHSTSSRSFFRSPLMRKRIADRSGADNKERTRRDSRTSRTSSLYNDDDADALGAELALEIQKQVPSRDANRTIRKKRSNRSSALTLALSPENAQQPQQRNLTSPAKASPSMRSSLVSPDLLSRSASSATHHRNISASGPSPGTSLASIDYPSRAESALTIRAPTTLERGGSPPLTPFPPWVSEEEDEGDGDCENRNWEGSTTRTDGKRHSYDGGHVPVSISRVEGRWVVSSVVHGLVLVSQFVVTLGVFSALMWVTVWKENEPGNDFDNWLWKFADPSLVVVLLLCSASLLIHEVKLLSSVALLYLESLILAATTLSSLVLWARCFQEESRSVKGVLMGCNVMMWGLALFGFIRAVVIWKVESEDDEDDQQRAVMYGTFVPWDGRRESV